jgi:hypothetical protein
LRNIFDQYSQIENRVTHAFLTALDRDRALLASFLSDVVGVKPNKKAHDLHILEQQYPGESQVSEMESERRGIPDGWIYDEEGWCVVIETKVIIPLKVDQIRRHYRTAERRGFEEITIVAITHGRLSWEEPMWLRCFGQTFTLGYIENRRTASGQDPLLDT